MSSVDGYLQDIRMLTANKEIMSKVCGLYLREKYAVTIF